MAIQGTSYEIQPKNPSGACRSRRPNDVTWKHHALTCSKVYSSTDHGLSRDVEGFAIGPDGTIYVLANTTTNSSLTYARIVKGVPNAGGTRSWSLLARTEPY